MSFLAAAGFYSFYLFDHFIYLLYSTVILSIYYYFFFAVLCTTFCNNEKPFRIACDISAPNKKG